jgi:hypothetical protein
MKHFFAVGAVALAALLATSALAEESLVSGLQVGKNPSPFDPLHVTGPGAGEKACLV